MYVVDRMVALVRPKKPMLDWLMSQPDNDVDLTLDQLRSDCTVLLVPQVDEPEDAISYVDDIYHRIFEMELASWYDETSRWPKDMSLKAFWEWFDVEIHTMVIDTQDADLRNFPVDGNANLH